MPTGITTKSVTCKKCNSTFKTLSELRAHQWAAHREMYANAIKASRSKKYALRAKKALAIKKNLAKAEENLTLAEAKLNGPAVLIAHSSLDGKIDSRMTVLELLAKLSKQRDFLKDVVDLIEGVARQ